MINYIKSDIICLNETHLGTGGEIFVDNYTSFLHNRELKHLKAPKHSGGVAILVKNDLLTSFSVKVIDKTIDGVLGLQFTNKSNDFTLILFACYLPPDNSIWGRDLNAFCCHLLTQLYLHQHADNVILCGDFNSRIGDLKDYVEGIDDYNPRIVIDKTKNSHGDTFIEFVKDGNLAVINGRINPENDNYTFVSNRGTSVVDYFLTPYDCLDFCNNFKVDLVSDVLEKCNAYNLLSHKCRAPDHSILTLTVKHSYIADFDQQLSSTHDQDVNGRKLYLFKNNPTGFLNSNNWANVVEHITNDLLVDRLNQDKLDKCYDDLCKSIFEDLDTNLEYKCISKNSKKRLKHTKPFWNNTLENLWRNMVKLEKIFIKYKGNSKQVKNKLRNDFKNAQSNFDKQLRKANRSYNRSIVLDIETTASENHKTFWDKLNKLGPRKKHNIPLKVQIDNDIISDKDAVMNKWKNDFQSLYNPVSDTGDFSNEFYDQMIENKTILENMMNNESYIENESLNSDFTFNEIKSFSRKLSNGKAVGIDLIPNEVLKADGIISLLVNLFNQCLRHSLTPSVWKKAIIKPIPKGSTTNPYLPLNYRGINFKDQS